jgi:acetate kinase
MGTRSGDLDPGAMQFIMNKHHLGIDEMLNVLNKKSGVDGVSGVSSDFRDLDNAAENGNDRAQLALDMFAYWVAKTAGSYVTAMNGADAIIFTAGVGENSGATRKAICDYFGYLGVTIDDEANKKRGEDVMISTPDSKVKVYVIPTNEELVIARDTRDIVCGK